MIHTKEPCFGESWSLNGIIFLLGNVDLIYLFVYLKLKYSWFTMLSRCILIVQPYIPKFLGLGIRRKIRKIFTISMFIYRLCIYVSISIPVCAHWEGITKWWIILHLSSEILYYPDMTLSMNYPDMTLSMIKLDWNKHVTEDFLCLIT